MGEVKLIDGGFALQLEQYVTEKVDGHPLWDSRFLLVNSHAVVLTNRDFIKAGSEIIHTNTYQATVDGFVQHMNQTRESALELIAKAVPLCKEAISLENKDGEVEVAGSVGPYGSSLHDGSEYTGSYCDKLTIDEFVTWHRERVDVLVKSGADCLAFETIPCSKEAVAEVRLLKEYPHIKAWIAFSVKDEEHISNGEPFVDAIAAVLAEAEKQGCSDRIMAIGINCVEPKLVSPLLAKAKAKFPGLPLIVYPQSGEVYNSKLQRWEKGEDMIPVSDYVWNWLELGVRYIGGCCRTTSDDIAAMRLIVDKWNATHK